MKKMIIGFSRPKGKAFPWFSWVIRAKQGFTRYSHVYVKFSSLSIQREIIYQASGTQVNYIGSVLFYKHVHVVEEFEIEISDEQYLKMMQYMVDNAGKPYSIKNILANVFRSEKLLDGDEGFVCSELAGDILEKFKGLVFDKPLDIIQPKDVYIVLKTLQNNDLI
ncbi:MAG TPA: hypothetical protein VI911_12035 [Patescibacteria group bacterium]|nr:hypothetical protein [Patescibacteria group bacterium]